MKKPNKAWATNRQCSDVRQINMSYTIDVTHVKISPNRDKALLQINSLRDELYEEDQELASRDKFLPLYEILVSKYPCICEDDGEDSPWSDGPLIDNFGSNHAIIGFLFESADEVFPFILSHAIDLGFTVYDGQSDKFYYPDGIGKDKPWRKFW